MWWNTYLIMYRINLALNIEKCQLFENLYKNFDLLNLIIIKSLYNIESYILYVYYMYR